jgi:ketosteroid isomerase-like protein
MDSRALDVLNPASARPWLLKAIRSRRMGPKQRMQDIMAAMSQGRVRPFFDAMAEDVTWRWMGVSQWSRTFEDKQTVIDTLFGGADDTLSPSSRVVVRCIHCAGDYVVVEHSGRNELPDGRRYDNNYC